MSETINDIIGPVHNSHLSALKLCEQKFDYSFTQQIEAKRPSLPLSRGIWLHYMLGAQHLLWGWQAGTLLDGLPESFHIDEIGEVPIVDADGVPVLEVVFPDRKEGPFTYPLSARGMLNLLKQHVWSRIFPKERDRYTDTDGVELPEACERILREYFYHYNKWPLPPDAKILGVEVDWQREHHDVMFEGRVDLVYTTGNLIVVRDWKSTSSTPDNEFKFMESQLNLYPWGLVPWLMKHGIDAKRATHSAVEFDYLITKIPTEPKINLDGTVSKRKIATTELTVKDFVKREGLKWKKSDVQHYMDNYTTGANFFEQRLVPRNQRVIHRLLDENVVATHRMLPLLNAERVAVRSVGRHCTFMCDFLPLCKGELYGDDVRYMRKKHYQPRNYLAYDRES